MAILVTGGTGYIGSHTVVDLLNHNYDVVIVDNYVNSKPEVLNRIYQITGKKPRFYLADIQDYYDERISSRITDLSSSICIYIDGSDLRLKK